MARRGPALETISDEARAADTRVSLQFGKERAFRARIALRGVFVTGPRGSAGEAVAPVAIVAHAAVALFVKCVLALGAHVAVIENVA